MPKTDLITNLLKENNDDVSAVKANMILVALGLLSEDEWPSSKYVSKIKKFKALPNRDCKIQGKRR